MLDSGEAARRLGVKLGTLYAYVSRGLIESHIGPDKRHHYFLAEDVERLVPRSRSANSSSHARLPTVSTSITHITDDGPAYRGIPVAELVAHPFEEVASLLVGAPVDSWEPFPAVVPTGLLLRDRMRCVAALTASFDPLRSSHDPTTVARAVGRLDATLAGSLAPSHYASHHELGFAADVASRLVPDDPEPFVVPINAAFVMFADHEISASTLAVRIAASTQADLYDAVLAGLGVLSGPAYAGGSELSLLLLERAHQIGVERAIDEEMRWRSRLPGFGVWLYPGGDPRFVALRLAVEPVLSDDRLETFRALIAFGEQAGLPSPKVELALAALVWAMDQEPAVATALFALARTVGWAAHYLEELEEEPNRFRSRGVYVTQDPPGLDGFPGLSAGR